MSKTENSTKITKSAFKSSLMNDDISEFAASVISKISTLMLSDKNHNIEVLSWSSSFSNDINQTSIINQSLFQKYWHKYNLSIWQAGQELSSSGAPSTQPITTLAKTKTCSEMSTPPIWFLNINSFWTPWKTVTRKKFLWIPSRSIEDNYGTKSKVFKIDHLHINNAYFH